MKFFQVILQVKDGPTMVHYMCNTSRDAVRDLLENPLFGPPLQIVAIEEVSFGGQVR